MNSTLVRRGKNGWRSSAGPTLVSRPSSAGASRKTAQCGLPIDVAVTATSRDPRSSQWSTTRGAGGCRSTGMRSLSRMGDAEVGGDAEALVAQALDHRLARAGPGGHDVPRRHGARAHAEGGQAAQAVGGDLGLAAVGVDETHAHAAVLVAVQQDAVGAHPDVPLAEAARPGGGIGRRLGLRDEQEVVPQAVRLGHAHQRRLPFRTGCGGGNVPMQRTFSSFSPALAHRIPPSAVRYTPWSVPRNASAPESGASGNRSRTGTTPFRPSPERRPRAARVLAAEEPAVAGGVQERAQPDEIGDGVAFQTGRRPGRPAVRRSIHALRSHRREQDGIDGEERRQRHGPHLARGQPGPADR